MELTTQLKTLAEKAETSEEFYSLARSEHLEISEEEAAKIFAEIYKGGELSDDELENVSGGYLDTAIRKQGKKLRSSLRTKKSKGC